MILYRKSGEWSLGHCEKIHEWMCQIRAGKFLALKFMDLKKKKQMWIFETCLIFFSLIVIGDTPKPPPKPVMPGIRLHYYTETHHFYIIQSVPEFWIACH